MEDKWDIYAWNNIIYFTRSWTGEVIYQASINVTDTYFEIFKIECGSPVNSNRERSLAVNTVHFLIKTLAFGEIYPHKVPATLNTDMEIALYSFNVFGRNCWYATFDDILDTAVTIKKEK